MLSLVRSALHRVISTPRGDSLAPVRVPKDLARRLNVALGSPLAPRDELAKRERARARLAELRAGGGKGPRVQRDAAPVLVYFEKDRNVRELVRIEELLGATAVPVDELVRQSGAPVGAVLCVLLELEVAGRLHRESGNRVSLG